MNRSRTLCLETLEQRQLLSHVMGSATALASAYAEPKAISVTGKITGTFSVSFEGTETLQSYKASGNLRGLGFVEMNATIPLSASDTNRGTMTLTSNQGMLQFGVVQKGKSAEKLTLQQGTGAFTGWKGNGTVTATETGSGYAHLVPIKNAFKLKLKP